MLAKRIIPCLDVKDGRVVKGINFEGLKDAGDPVELAAFYDQEGADELVFLDITASAEERDTILDIVNRTAQQVFIPFTVGGGIRSVEDMRKILQAGADKIGINTAAVLSPDLIYQGAKKFGNQCIVVAIDAKRTENTISGWEVFTHGGRKPTGLDAVNWAKKAEGLGAGEFLLTSMDADGTKAGYDIPLTRVISEQVGIPVIASGGAGCPRDLLEVLAEGKADAVLAASIFHYGEYSVKEAKTYLQERGIGVRL